MTFRSFFQVAVVGCVGLFIGCEVQTESQPPLSYPPANHVVINEVYTLPGTNPNAHSWLEIFNPTSQTVDLARWSISYTTLRLNVLGLRIWRLQRDTIRTPVDTTIVKRLLVANEFYNVFATDTTSATYDVPIIRVADPIPIRLAGTATVIGTFRTDSSKLELRPNEFLTLVNDLNRLRIYNTIGPGNGPQPTASPILPFTAENFKTNIYEEARTLRDTANPRLTIPDTLYGYTYLFLLRSTDQIVLKDEAGRAVDVVRYGNYVHSGPDPYAANQSIGAVPEFESIARYGGAYKTGNSANDFYITRPGLRPIPHWLSQLYKK